MNMGTESLLAWEITRKVKEKIILQNAASILNDKWSHDTIYILR